jgi:three-Cys-motif partner protein
MQPFVPVEHEFGGYHTELKLSVIENYLKAFSTALNEHFSRLIYIDAFAGSGSRTVRVEAKEGTLLDAPIQESIERRRGSAQIALDITPPFSKLIFIEQNPRYCEALKAIATEQAGRDIEIVEGDANIELRRILSSIDWNDARGVLFLDPYGMEVEWATLEAAALTKAVDVWFLFSLSGLYRQATRDKKSMDEDKKRAITRMLGTDAWENELYAKEEKEDLFGREVSEQRNADVKGLERYVQMRLQAIFPKVLEPLPLPIEQRPQRYSLFCAISNPSPKAIGLATKIASHILKVGISSK